MGTSFSERAREYIASEFSVKENFTAQLEVELRTRVMDYIERLFHDALGSATETSFN